MNKSIGFIGGGRVTKILLQGFTNKNVKFRKIVVTDTNPEVLVNLKKQFPEVEASEAKVRILYLLHFILLLLWIRWNLLKMM